MNSFFCRLSGVLGIVLLSLSVAFGTDGPRRDTVVVSTRPNQVSWAVQAQLQEALAKEFRFGEVNRAMVAKDLMTDLKVNVSKAAADAQNTAASLFQYLDSQNKYKEGDFTASDLATLPVGIKKTLGNQQIEVGFLKAAFYSNYAELTAFVRLRASATDPNSSVGTRTLFFGAEKVRFTKAGGVESFKASLLGDIVVPVGGFSLVIKGGMNLATGYIDENSTSFVRVQCGAFEEAKIVAEVAFPRDKIIPLNGNMEDTGGRVTARFMAGINQGFEDIVTEVDFGAQPYFALASYPRLGFSVSRAVLDLSSRATPGIPFPTDYPATGAGWRGVYIQNLSITLPSEFQKQNGQRIRVGANDLIFDSEGVTGNFYAGGGLLSINEGSASGWGFSLNNFAISIQRNMIKGGAFDGSIKIPISQQPIQYAAAIRSDGEYEVGLRIPGQIKFDVWRANATIDLDRSFLSMRVNRSTGKFEPKATLSGRMDILSNSSGDAKDDASATVKFSGIQFENLELTTQAPYFTLNNGRIDFAYSGSTQAKLGSFGVSLKKIGVIAANNQPKLDVVVAASLMNGGISGETGFEVAMVFDQSQGGFRVAPSDFVMKELFIDSKVGNSFRLQGAVRYFDNNELKEFRGKVNLTISALSDQPICAAGVFGYDKAKDLHYWYVEAKAPIPGGIPIAPPLVINSISGALYHNMIPVALTGNQVNSINYTCETPTTLTSRVRYEPNDQIKLGFKAAVGFGFSGSSQISDVLDGLAGLEMTFGSSGGIRQISLFGEAALTKNINLSGDQKADFLNQKLQNIVANQNSVPIKDSWNIADIQQKTEKQYGSTSSAVAQMSVRARLGMLYDFESKVFHGEGELFMNVANGVVRGSGPNDRVGKAVFHFDPNKWYIHVGKMDPTYERVGMSFNAGFVKSNASAYLMIGHDIPTQLPCPGTYVSNAFPELNCQNGSIPRTDVNIINSGKGFALGAAVKFQARLSVGRRIAWAEAKAELGFDILLQKVNGSTYGGRAISSNFGFNNWYGEGQVYAYVSVEAGIWFVKAKGEAAARLNIGGPNPWWAKGKLKINVKLLGAIKFSIDPTVTIGDIYTTQSI